MAQLRITGLYTVRAKALRFRSARSFHSHASLQHILPALKGYAFFIRAVKTLYTAGTLCVIWAEFGWKI
jgi:hypothetical protein